MAHSDCSAGLLLNLQQKRNLLFFITDGFFKQHIISHFHCPDALTDMFLVECRYHMEQKIGLFAPIGTPLLRRVFLTYRRCAERLMIGTVESGIVMKAAGGSGIRRGCAVADLLFCGDESLCLHIFPNGAARCTLEAAAKLRTADEKAFTDGVKRQILKQMLVDVADDAIDGGSRCRCGILRPLVGGTLHFKKQRWRYRRICIRTCAVGRTMLCSRRR